MESIYDVSTTLAQELAEEAPAPGAAPEPLRLEHIGTPVEIPSPTSSRLSLAATLTRRRSSLKYFGDPLPGDTVLDIVRRGLAFDESANPTLAATVPLEAFVFLNHSTGRAEGIYHVTTTGVHYLHDPLNQDEMEDLGVQREFGHASALISVAGDVDQAEQCQSTHGYRTLTVRAASATYLMWLDAVALGWIGTVFAGFIPASVRKLLESDAVSRHQLFALSIGPERR